MNLPFLQPCQEAKMKLTAVFLFVFAIIPGFNNFSQNNEIPFSFDNKDFASIQISGEKKVASDSSDTRDGFPVDAPAHNCYSLEDKKEFPAFKKGARYLSPAYSFICLVPTFDSTEKDFAQAYPNFGKAITNLDKLLKTKPAEFKQFDDLFDFPYNNSGWSFKSKVQYLDYKNVSGVFFLTQYTQELSPNPANNEELTANFQGLTKDKKYYVAARFGVTHSSLPKGIDFTDENLQKDALMASNNDEINTRVRIYLRAEKEKIDKLPENSFKPSLLNLKDIIASISTNK
jgi:hypothetical protein